MWDQCMWSERGMMPLYPMSSLRGMHHFSQGMPPSGSASNMYGESGQPGSEDDSDDELDGSYDSVHSAGSPTNDLYNLVHVAQGELSEDYGEYLQDLLGQQDAGASSDSDGDAPSGASSHPGTPPLQMASRLMDIGLSDLEWSEVPDIFGEEHSDDSHESDSDGELSGINSAEDDDDEVDEEYDEVPSPPQLPSVSEERLQEVWPLGDQSFSIFLCPITHDVMTDPVVSADGYTYERVAIARWFETSRKSPVTGQTLPHTDLVANHSVRTLLKMLIDMTAGSPEAPKALPALASSHVASLASAASTASASAAGSARAELHPNSEAPRIAPGHRLSPDSIVQGGVAARSGSLPPPPPALVADRLREQSQTNRDRESSPSHYEQAAAEVQQIEAAAMAALQAAESSSPTSMAASTAALVRRQQRAVTAQVLISDGPSGSSSDPSPQPALSSRHVLLSRPSSQPQSHSQSSTSSSLPQRPQSSAGCQQQRPHAPSTALPPLRPGQATPKPPESGGSRGVSPPLSVPPLSHRSGPHMGRLPGQPAFPALEPGSSSQSSNSSTPIPHSRLERGQDRVSEFA